MIPWRQQTSAVAAPRSRSARIAMICSSENLDFRFVRLLLRRPPASAEGPQGAQVIRQALPGEDEPAGRLLADAWPGALDP